jgi:hypothetical protein
VILYDNNVAKCSLTIMHVSTRWLAKKTNENFGRLMSILQGENTIKCNMKYQYVSIACPNKGYVYC